MKFFLVLSSCNPVSLHDTQAHDIDTPSHQVRFKMNQHTRELISARNTKHKYNKKDLIKSPRVTLTWHACKYKVHKLHQRYILKCSG